MLVSRIELENFLSHFQSEIDLPLKGLVVVTGANGSGKSSLIEAVAVACWGKTLRGDSPWPMSMGQKEGAVTIATESLHVTRSRKGTKKSLVFYVDDVSETYETTTKAQTALESSIGSFDLWRRTHVFSSSDASSFTMATDSERKKLLEGLLGVAWFDKAYQLARADLSRAKHRCAETTARIEATEGYIKKTQLTLEQLQLLDVEELDLASLTARLERFNGWRTTAQLDRAAYEADLREASNAGAVHKQEIQRAQEHYATFRSGKCPTCAQAIAPEKLERLKLRLATAQDKLHDAQKRAVSKVQSLTNAIIDLSEEVESLAHQCSSIQSTINADKAGRHKAKQVADMHAHTQQCLDDEQAKLTSLLAQQDEALLDLHELEACVAVFGLKGVRAQILGGALGGIESLANNWLRRFTQKDLSLRLRSYTEKKAGGTNDSISLQIEGPGAVSYRGMSGGERRRVDIAVLLALTEVASAAHGASKGTLWMDEVFDALDDYGRKVVVEVLAEMSQDRPIVVITHSDLSESLQAVATLQLRVEAGKVIRC